MKKNPRWRVDGPGQMDADWYRRLVQTGTDWHYKHQQRQIEKSVRTRAPQDDNGRGRSKDGESRCKESTGGLQSDMWGMACAQERMELQTASVTGLDSVTEGLAEVRHICWGNFGGPWRV